MEQSDDRQDSKQTSDLCFSDGSADAGRVQVLHAPQKTFNKVCNEITTHCSFQRLPVDREFL